MVLKYLTSGPVGQKLSRQELSDSVGESERQIQRYVRLTELIPEILDMVDEGKIALRPAVELSYIPRLQQGQLWEIMDLEDCTPSHAQAIRLRRLSEEGVLTPEAMERIVMEVKPNQKERLVLRGERFSKLFPPDLPMSKREDYVAAAMEFYGRHRERQRTVDSTGKRTTLISFTKVGEASAAEIQDEKNENFDRAFANLTNEEKEQLIVLLKKLTAVK